MKKLNLRKIIMLGLFLAISIVISILESFISFNIPGIKLGLANCITLVCLFQYSIKETTILVLFRILLVSFLLGTFLSVPFYMSLTGGVFALLSMIIVKRMKSFSIIGISMIGAIFHSIGQILATFFILESVLTIYYLPVILICSLFSGLFTGFVAIKVNQYLKTKF